MSGLEATVSRGPVDGLLEDWDRLHRGQPGATPFSSAGWARAWWPHFAGTVEPYVVTVRDGDRIAGLAPLVRRRRAGLRLLEPVGIEPGDYWDVLAEPSHAEAVAAAVAGALARGGREWDVLVLRTLPPGSPLLEALEAAGLPLAVRLAVPAPAIELPDDFDAYLARLSANRRQNLRKHLRRLDRGEVELVEVTDPAAVPAFVQRWQGLRRRQWEAAGRDIDPDHLAPRFAAFLVDCLTALVPAGQALAWEFRRGGDVLGAYVNFVDEGAFYWYLGGFDPAVAALGLGKIAIGHGIRTSIAAGRRRFDFTRGPEPYKYWYGATDRPLVSGVVRNGRLGSRAVTAGVQAALAVRRRQAARRT